MIIPTFKMNFVFQFLFFGFMECINFIFLKYKLIIYLNLIKLINFKQQSLFLEIPIFNLVLWFTFLFKNCNYSNFYLKGHLVEFLNYLESLEFFKLAQKLNLKIIFLNFYLLNFIN